MDPELLHKALVSPDPKGPTARLAETAVDHFLARPVCELVAPERVVALLRMALSGWDDARLEQCVNQEFTRVTDAMAAWQGSLESHVLPALGTALRNEVHRPLPLDPKLVMALADQPATRALVRDLLQTTLTNFVKQASNTVQESRVLGGVMSRARGLVSATMAGGIIAAVGESLNQEAERRVRDFVDGAVSATLQQVVGQVTDPRHEPSYGALRQGVVDSALRLPVAQWVAQSVAAAPHRRALGLLRAVRQAANTPGFLDWVAQGIRLIEPADSKATVQTLLEAAGALVPVRRAAIELLKQELQPFVESAAFQSWLVELCGSSTPLRAPATPRARKKRGPS
jgi:hypothetical protein